MLCFLLTACVYDRREECPQGLDVQLYSKTPCSVDTLYPTNPQHLMFYLFDAEGILVSSLEEEQVRVHSTYRKRMETTAGLFTVVAWAGVDDDLFERPNAPRAGITKKEDLHFRLRRTQLRSSSLEGRKVYYGESAAVYIPDATDAGSIYKAAAVNLSEQTNRLQVVIDGLPDAAGYEVLIESRNGAMSLDGSVAPDDLIEYHAASTLVEEGTLTASFTLLRLSTGLSTTLIVRNSESGAELYRGDLLGTLLLKNPHVNLACDRDFTIRFTTADACRCGTYTVMEIWVNNWLVHSYNTDLH
ncbi:MAG: FimB/Mfa2 family fimbrial subunit [Mediterranea sp.]|jgi:hypothetical protein|nr:FimB/Mfa2 family fimbrial subunit [Mediterranea sp.]